MADDNLKEARARANALRRRLPQSVGAVELGVRSKAPFKLLCMRGALIWRTEELARTACDALERDDFSAAAILTRAVTENAALTWKLMRVLDARGNYTHKKMHDLLDSMLAGGEPWPEAPKRIRVGEHLREMDDELREMDEKVGPVRSSYKNLSEIVHPNWSGVFGMYSKSDNANRITHFGRGLRDADSLRSFITYSLLGSLAAFEYACDRISEVMPVFLAELKDRKE